MAFYPGNQPYYYSQDQYGGWNNTINPAPGFNNFGPHHRTEIIEKVEAAEYNQFGGFGPRENVEIIKERVETDGGRFFQQPRQEMFEAYKYQNY